MSIVRTRKKDCEAWQGGCACSLRPPPPPAGATCASGLCLHHTARPGVHTQGWAHAELAGGRHEGQVRSWARGPFSPDGSFTSRPHSFSRSLPPFLSLCISISVSSPCLGLSLSPPFLFPINTCRSLGPWVQPPPPTPRCAASGAPLPEFLGLISIWPLRD